MPNRELQNTPFCFGLPVTNTLLRVRVSGFLSVSDVLPITPHVQTPQKMSFFNGFNSLRSLSKTNDKKASNQAGLLSLISPN